MIINHNVDAMIACNKANAVGKTKANAMENFHQVLE